MFAVRNADGSIRLPQSGSPVSRVFRSIRHASNQLERIAELGDPGLAELADAVLADLLLSYRESPTDLEAVRDRL